MRVFNLWVTNYHAAQARLLEESRTMRALKNQVISFAKMISRLSVELESLKNENASLRLRLLAITTNVNK